MAKKRRGWRRSPWILTLTAVVLLLILGGVFIYWRHVRQTAKNQPANNATVNTPSADTNLPRKGPVTPSTNSGGSSQSAGAAAPAKPTLNKSSGNGPTHTVPAGILMNFICNSDAGNSCTIILTDTGNANHVINLGAKTVASGQFDQPAFASWDWTSVAGSWSIVARATNAGGGSADSTPQPLTVQ